MENTNFNPEHDIEFMIQLMLETGYSITEIEKTLGVNIRARMLVVEEVLQVIRTKTCGKIEVNCN